MSPSFLALLPISIYLFSLRKYCSDTLPIHVPNVPLYSGNTSATFLVSNYVLTDSNFLFLFSKNYYFLATVFIETISSNCQYHFTIDLVNFRVQE